MIHFESIPTLLHFITYARYCIFYDKSPVSLPTFQPYCQSGAFGEHSTLSVSLSSDLNHRPLTVPYGTPRCVHMNDHTENGTFISLNFVSGAWSWIRIGQNRICDPGLGSAVPHKAPLTTTQQQHKAAINIHCCRWVLIWTTHWSMNADCGSNSPMGSVTRWRGWKQEEEGQKR